MTINTIANLALLAVSAPASAWAIWQAVKTSRRVRELFAQQGRALEAANDLIEQQRKYQEELESERYNVRRMLSARPEDSTLAAVIRFAWECRGYTPPSRPRKGLPS